MYNMCMKVELDREFLAAASERARLCKHLYVHDRVDPPAGWTMLATSDDIAPSTSGFFAAVYQRTDPDSGQQSTVIAIRGTNDKPDLKSNFMIFSRRLPPQFNDTLAFVGQVCDRLGLDCSEIELTGHSLGGYLARTMARVQDFRKAWCFSSPGPDERTQQKLQELGASKLPEDRIIHFRSRHDPIGLFGPDEKITIEVDTPNHHHDIAFMGRTLAGHAGRPVEDCALSTPITGKIFSVFNAVSKMLTGAEMLRSLIKKLSTYEEPNRQSMAIYTLAQHKPAAPPPNL